MRPTSRQRKLRPMFSISETDKPEASAPPTSEPAEVPATQSTRISCSSSARKTPTWAMPLAAPPESASPTFGFVVLFLTSNSKSLVPLVPLFSLVPLVTILHGIQNSNFRMIARVVQKAVDIGLNFGFSQNLFNLRTRLCESGHNGR